MMLPLTMASRPVKPDFSTNSSMEASMAARRLPEMAVSPAFVVRIIEKRVSALVAAECLVDHSPPPPPKDDWFPNFAREPGAGRPTKKDRRTLDRFRYPR